MTSADGYTRCEQGHDHWGRAGAAGLLLVHREADVSGGQVRYLVQHRAPGTHHGDTWGIPGGALGWGESVEDGASRETTEELGAVPPFTIRHRVVDDHGGWAYTTVVADVADRFTPVRATWETGPHGTRWCTAPELDELRLHHGFRATLPRLLDLDR